MSDSPTISHNQGAPQLEARRFSLPEAITAGTAVILLAHVPFVLLHFVNLWRYRPHYEFFPFVLAAFGWLLWKRWPREGCVSTRMSRWVSHFLAACGFCLLAGSVILFSPWLAAVAAVLTTGSLLLRLTGTAFFRNLLPVWLLLWLVVPPPFRLDSTLIRALQRLTSLGSSALLELAGMHHLLAGNVFRLPDRELFVVEACSGVHSQLVLLATCLIFAVTLRRSWLHTLLLVASAFAWSAAANILRVTVVVAAAARYQVNLSTGWVHEVLGYTLVVVGFLMVLSCDRLLRGLLGPIFDEEGYPADDPFSRLWNTLIASFHAEGQSEDVVDSEREGRGKPNGENAPSRTREASGGRWPIVAATAFGALGLVQIPLLFSSHQVEIDAEHRSMTIGEEWLPDQLGDWHRVDFTLHHREQNSDEGQYSGTWRYESDGRVVHVSIDFPFAGWHELTRCYAGHGWREVSRHVHSPSDGGGHVFVEVEMEKPTVESGLLMFSLSDNSGRPVQPRASHWRNVRTRLASGPLGRLFGMGDYGTSLSETNVQMQLFVTSGLRPDQSERQAMRELFLEFQTQLRDRWLHAEGE